MTSVTRYLDGFLRRARKPIVVVHEEFLAVRRDPEQPVVDLRAVTALQAAADHRAAARKLQHVFQMDDRKRRLARHQNELAVFLQHHIRRTLNQILAQARGDGSQRPHGTRADHHRVRRIGAGGHRRKPFFAPEHAQLPGAGIKPAAEQLFHFFGARRQSQLHFLLRDDLRHLRIQQINAIAACQQHFQQADAVGHAGCAGVSKGDG